MDTLMLSSNQVAITTIRDFVTSKISGNSLILI